MSSSLSGDVRNNRAALFDGIEEGGIRASSSYSHEIDEQDNERAVEGLQDRVNLLKRLSGDIHEEVETHNHMLDRMVYMMQAMTWFIRGVLSGTMDRFKMVFETKSSRRMFTLVASFVVIFLIVYYLTRHVYKLYIKMLKYVVHVLNVWNGRKKFFGPLFHLTLAYYALAA
ncbi:hypothetical protein GH714_026735 [Hevea brasiliensis]|uniref:t-SNARE coiled-coil homology domain-containing protein n=1 Tax=Hevea brasiliensis TaxID=3981 RepID=A0A6A6NKB8_HEVBR|nr:hypothetical protein GH714_026735 [Hevea brasiliensis]